MSDKIIDFYVSDPKLKWLGNTDRHAIIERVGLDALRNKDLAGKNLEGIYLGYADLNGVDILGANLKNTGAIVVPSQVPVKLLGVTALYGCVVVNDFSRYSYDKYSLPNLEGVSLVNETCNIKKLRMCRNMVYEKYGLEFLNKVDEYNYIENNKKRDSKSGNKVFGKILGLFRRKNRK